MKETKWIGKSGGKVSDPDNWDNGLPDYRTKAIFDVSERTEITWDLKSLGIPVEYRCDPEDVIIYISSDCMVGGSYFVPDAIREHFESFKDDSLNPDDLDRPPPGYGMFQATRIWTNDGGNGEAGTDANWSGNHAPVAGDTASFRSSCVDSCLWNIDRDLADIDWQTGYTGTMTLANAVTWNFEFNPTGGVFDTDSSNNYGMDIDSLLIGASSGSVDFNANGSSIVINGDAQRYNNTNSHFNCGTSTVTLNGTGVLYGFYVDTNNNHLHKLVVNVSFTTTLNSGNGVRDQATINGTVEGNGPSLYLAVGYSGNADPLVLGDSGDVEDAFIVYTSPITYNVVGTIYGRLTVTTPDTGSAVVSATLLGSITVEDQLLIGTNTTYSTQLDTGDDCSITTTDSTNGSIDIGTSGGGQGMLVANESIITVATDFNNYSGFTAETSTIVFTPGADRTFKTADNTVYNVTFPTGGDTYTVNGDLVFSGTVLANNNAIKVDSDWTATGSFTRGTSHVHFEAPLGTSTITGMNGLANKFYDVTIKASCSATTLDRVTYGSLGGFGDCLTKNQTDSGLTLDVVNVLTIPGTFYVSTASGGPAC